MREQLKQLVERINESADQLRQSDNLMSETLHGIADELEAAIKPQWVPVGERFPGSFKVVWFITPEWPVPLCGFFHSAEWHAYGMGVIDRVTHWHEIDYPEPPDGKS